MAPTKLLSLHQPLLMICKFLILLHALVFSSSGDGARAAPWITTKAVPRLPGYIGGGALPFSLETGYVGQDDGVRLFYYFIQSERAPAEDPVLLWLTGGPGCSALSGLVYEVGPLSFDFDGYAGGLPTLLYKTEAWTQVSNVIFMDSPAGTGFSYDTAHAATPSDTMVVRQLRIFLETWLDKHPQFLSNPLYIAGDSYSGIIIPSLAMEIAKGIESGDERLINLKGVIAGNPVTDIRLDDNGQLPFLHGMGIIPDELYEPARKSCRGEYHSPSNPACANSLQAINDCTRDLNGAHVLEPTCLEYPDLSIVHKKPTTLPENGTNRLMLESATLSSVCRNSTYFLSEVWANDEAVRESLGIRKGTVPLWQRCDFHLPYTKEISSTVGEHLALITRGYRSMVYSGDHDSKISFVGTQAWIRQLNLSITDDWRPWYVDSQVAGVLATRLRSTCPGSVLL
ncbi:serine carboxypeptidase-like 6 isoform X2 [Brachypodium distachyon]|uniref:serine carboxypeptidase-like 6 isoform X2 n=1 Tax=Brachypodium distachyon TaxID=15368 RepID=UPI0006E49ECC|nr:serine carboxypeptidase-like 6 isoform X2 [Brachypodium distachyon]|eukprot:XP_014755513.1 serine carboxypeptidase-like 6 isoform X2 [Brachypodium distachyon]